MVDIDLHVEFLEIIEPARIPTLYTGDNANIRSIYSSGQDTHPVYWNIRSIYSSGQDIHPEYRNIRSIYSSGQDIHPAYWNIRSIYSSGQDIHPYTGISGQYIAPVRIYTLYTGILDH